MPKKLVIALFSLYFLSRIFFINSGPTFFDSPEYLKLFALPNFMDALTHGHYPYHLGYIILFWPVYHLAEFFKLFPGNTVIVLQIVLSMVTVWSFYRFCSWISDSRTALIASVFLSLVPLFWIITDSIMMENAYLFLFFLSISLLISYLEVNRNRMWLVLSLLCLGIACITHYLAALWLPLLWYSVFIKSRTFFWRYVMLSSAAIILAYFANMLFIVLATHSYSLQGIFHYIFGLGHNVAQLPFALKSLLIIARDFSLLLLRNYTILLTLCAFIALGFAWRKDKQLFIIGILWILPALYINLWWDSLLPGRYASITGFGIAFLAAWLLKNIKPALVVVLVYLLWTTLPAVNLLRHDAPYVTEALYTATLPANSLFIESHFARPQIQDTYRGKYAAVNDQLLSVPQIKNLIDTYLKQNKPVYISSAALSDPYGLYTGPYLHVLSLSYASQPELKSMLSNYTIKEQKTLNSRDNIIMYQITTNQPSPYPSVPNLIHSPRRLDAQDPLWNLYYKLQGFSKTNYME